MLQPFNIPDNMSLVVNDYIPPYDFTSSGKAMLRINGSGLISSDGANSVISHSGVTAAHMSGEFEFDMISGELPQIFQFIGVSLSGELDVKAAAEFDIHFVNCVFDEGTRIRITGAPKSVVFSGCEFAAGAIVDMHDIEIKPEVVECLADESAEFIVSDQHTPSMGWAVPGLMLIAASAVALISHSAKIEKVKEEEHVAK